MKKTELDLFIKRLTKLFEECKELAEPFQEHGAGFQEFLEDLKDRVVFMCVFYRQRINLFLSQGVRELRAYQRLAKLEQEQREELKAALKWYSGEKGGGGSKDNLMLYSFDKDIEETLFTNRNLLKRYRENIKEKENG